MVTLLLVFLYQAFADTTLTGRDLNHLTLSHEQGFLELSFARGSNTQIHNSNLSQVTGHKAELLDFVWSLTSATSLDFSQASICNSRWVSSRLDKADFRGADLREALFKDVTISHCSFDNADLRGTQFQEAVLIDCSFKRAKYNQTSQLPFDFTQAEAWGMIYVP